MPASKKTIPASRRRKTPTVTIGNIRMGGRFPVVIQAMTDTPTADIPATFRQTQELIEAGAEMVRWTVNDDRAARAVPEIVRMLRDRGYDTPVIGDFHFNGHVLLTRYPQTARVLDKYRINPGNIGKGKQRDENFAAIVKIAREYDKPIRIGVNWGSLDPEMLSGLMAKSVRRKRPGDSREIVCRAMIQSALSSAEYALKLGLKKNWIVLSVKMSHIPDMVEVYTRLARRCDLVLHLGLTEAGADVPGITASSAALAILLNKGIGDTIRVSLTPQPGVPRSREVEVAKALLQALGLRYFAPRVISCPGCGRTQSGYFRTLAEEVRSHIRQQSPDWKRRYPGVEQLTVAVMGCVVNGPGESRNADIGISLPGAMEEPKAPVYIDGKKIAVLSGNKVAEEFVALLEKYIRRRFG